MLWTSLFFSAPAKAKADTPLPSTEGGSRARVVIVQDPSATDAFRPRLDVVQTMVHRGITNLTGKASVSEAWNSIVATQEVVGLKVFSAPGPNSGTRPAVVAAIIEDLIAAGMPRKNIIIWDRQSADLRLAGYYELAKRYGVRAASSTDSGYDESMFYDTPLLGNLVFGDLEFEKKKVEGVGRKSFASKLVAREITKIINITPLLNQNFAGVSGNLYGLSMGSVDNIVRFESDPERLATAVPEIYAKPWLGDKVVLNIVDALISQYEGGDRGLLHYSSTLNQLRFSRDPVALDVLSLKELDRERQTADAPNSKASSDLYNNAALLELGINDIKRIDVETLKPTPSNTEAR
jgi:hypothetical protein